MIKNYNDYIYIYIHMKYFEIQRMITNNNAYIYIYIYIYVNYLEILRMIQNYTDYIYIYIHELF